MILVDRQIKSLCMGRIPDNILDFHWVTTGNHLIDAGSIPAVRHLVEPYDPAMVNPCSLDIRIGSDAKLLLRYNPLQKFLAWFTDRELPEFKEVDLSKTTKAKPFWIKPGQPILVSSLETFNIPNFVCAQFRLKSSRGREFYEHLEAGFIDPGWHGSKLTMEMVNHNVKPLPLYFGMPIGQLVFSMTLRQPDKSYAKTGRYNNDKTVMESKG